MRTHHIITTLCLSAFLLVSSLTSKAEAQRYIPRMSWAEVGAGSTEALGFYAQVGAGFYTRKKHHWKFMFNYRQDYYPINTFKVPDAVASVESGYYVKLFADRKKTVFLSAGLEGIVGYEWINFSKDHLADGTLILSKNHAVYGGALAIEMEYFINDKYVLLLHAKEKCLGGSSVGMWHTEYGLGIKMMLGTEK